MNSSATSGALMHRIDYARIHGLPRPDPSKPDYALTERGKRWCLCFYDREWKTQMLSLWTDDFDKAVELRNEIYRKLKASGKLIFSKKASICQMLLEKPECIYAIGYTVNFQGFTGKFKTLQEAQKFRNDRAREILERAQANPMAPPLRGRTGRKFVRKERRVA